MRNEDQIARLQRELDESNALKSALFDGSSDGLAILSDDGTVLECNRAWERIVDLKRFDIVGKTDVETHNMAGYRGPYLWTNIATANFTGAILLNIKGDTVLMTAHPHRNVGGALRYVILTARNLTYLNHLRDQIEHHGAGEHGKIEDVRIAHVKSVLESTGLGEIVVLNPAFRDYRAAGRTNRAA